MPKYRFDDIIINSTVKRAGNPGDETIFITTNHLIPNCLTISEWGVKEAFSDEKLVIKKGDVLFIKRDPQNHQVAIAPIDGLFTGFGMVFRPKSDVIIPEFLPYFITSDTFIGKASSIAVGTKYKTANWSELKQLEFDIPSKDKQHELLAVITEIEKLMNNYDTLISDLETAKASFYNEKVVHNKDSAIYSLGELMFLKNDTIRVDDPNMYEYITYDEIAKNAMPRKASRSNFYAYRLETNQLFANRHNFFKGAVTLVPEKYDGYITSNQAQIFDVNQAIILPEFLHYMLTRPTFLKSLENVDLSTDNWNYSFSKHKISVPSKSSQKNFLDFSTHIEKSLTHTTKCKAQAYETLQSLLCEHIKA